jgi:hypothetical protein
MEFCVVGFFSFLNYTSCLNLQVVENERLDHIAL